MPTSTLGARDSNSYSCTITVDGASATVLSQFAGGKLRLRREAFGQSQCSVGIGEAFCFFSPFSRDNWKVFWFAPPVLLPWRVTGCNLSGLAKEPAPWHYIDLNF